MREACLASRDTWSGQTGIAPDIRSAPFKGYVIFFRYERGRFEVVNILEGDIERYFADDPS